MVALTNIYQCSALWQRIILDRTRPNPTQPNPWVNPTDGHVWVRDPYCQSTCLSLLCGFVILSFCLSAVLFKMLLLRQFLSDILNNCRLCCLSKYSSRIVGPGLMTSATTSWSLYCQTIFLERIDRPTSDSIHCRCLLSAVSEPHRLPAWLLRFTNIGAHWELNDCWLKTIYSYRCTDRVQKSKNVEMPPSTGEGGEGRERGKGEELFPSDWVNLAVEDEGLRREASRHSFCYTFVTWRVTGSEQVWNQRG